MKQLMRLLVGLVAVALCLPVAAAAAQERCQMFPETGYQVCGRLLDYWEQNGGLPVFGYPIGPQSSQQVEGRALQIQLFERERMELHPENAPPYDVLLGRLGADALGRAGRDWKRFSRATPSTPNYFAQTGHAIAPEFWGFWAGHGLEFDGQPGASFDESLALFGMPLSEPAVEVNPTDRRSYLIQWFERARFELHPENAGTPYEVLLGLLTAESGRPPAPPQPAQSGVAAEVIALVNRERATAGCPALTSNDALTRIAQEHSQDMASNDFFDHTGSDGRTTFQRMQDAGYRFRRAAENVAAGTFSAADTVALWMNSPGHRANILNCELREIGVGYIEDHGDKLNYGSYWTQDFGTR
jgi:uncharacterized protein YkwD